jgi:site-specific DNA recombinase
VTPKRAIRCAVYTRKSTDEGLDIVFNTLQAQREACEAYVKSQAGEGWIVRPELYDDGGWSGGTLDRPALTRLLAEIDKGRVDMVVVYKIDRLTRSLADFAKIVERLEAKNASFVSVTQSFNTATSMGRLTLNVLLSFAQFEREIGSERIRDKIAASRRKGMWTGGIVPLGYDGVNRSLVPNPAEAKIVRLIFERYLTLGSILALRRDLKHRGIGSKRRISKAGRVSGGGILCPGALAALLKNRTYIGEVVHKGASYPGLHEPILPRALFDRVQESLAEKRVSRAALTSPSPEKLLTGLIFDDRGYRMSPSHAQKPGGRRYRYYISRALLTGERAKAGSVPRVSAPVIERLVSDCLTRLAGPEASLRDSPRLALHDLMREMVRRVEIQANAVIVTLDREAIARSLRSSRTNGARDGSQMALDAETMERLNQSLRSGEQLEAGDDHVRIRLPVSVKILSGPRAPASFDDADKTQRSRVDAALVKALVRSHAWLKMLEEGDATSLDDLARKAGQHRTTVIQGLPLAFLSPDITKLILQGRQPAHLTLALLSRADVPRVWEAQRRMLLSDSDDCPIPQGGYKRLPT